MYIWTLTDGERYFTRYVGETVDGFGQRHVDHLAHVRRLWYALSTADAVATDRYEFAYEGVWREARDDGHQSPIPAATMRRYADKARQKFGHLVEPPHIQSVRIFLADLKTTDSRFTKRVERLIGQTICSNVRRPDDQRAARFYPAETVLGVPRRVFGVP